jgi:hypothetical protein
MKRFLQPFFQKTFNLQKRIFMRHFMFLAVLLIGALSNASVLSDTMLKYKTSDINNKCHVITSETNKGIYLEIIGSDSRLSMSYMFSNMQQTADVITLSGSDYPGTAKAYFIPEDYSMNVIMTWEDAEGGLDSSTYCELPANSVGTSPLIAEIIKK